MPLLIFLLAFGALARIAYGALAPYRDSGDLVAAAVSLGIAHPPGYPLYVLLSKAWLTLFPFANFAFRANLFSVFCSAAAAALLYAVLSSRFSKSAAGLGALSWLLAPSVVQLSIVSEMYSLNALICVVILWALSRNQWRWTILAFFLFGLGLNNHPTLVFLGPGLALFAWRTLPPVSRLEKSAALLKLSLWAALGWTLVLYVPIRSFQNPAIDWGNPETLRNLWRLITRSDYGGLRLHPEQSQFIWTAGAIVNQLALFGRAAWMELRWIALPFFLIGIARSFAPREIRRPETALIGVSWLLAGPIFFLLSNLPIHEKTTLPILEPYMLMVQILAAFWIAAGWDQTARWLERFQTAGAFKVRWAAAVVAALLIVALGLPHSRRNQFYAYDYGKNLGKTLPPQSSLYEPDDVTAFTFSYLQTGEHYRKDVALLMTLKTFWGYEQVRSRHPEIAPAGEFPNAQSFIAALLARHGETGRPLFADHPSKFPDGLSQYPSGLLARAGNPPSLEAFNAAQNAFHFYVERGSVRREGMEFFSAHLLSKMSSSLNNAGVWLQGRRDLKAARAYFEKALFRDSSLTPAWNNLGLNYFLQGDFAGAERVFRLGLARGEAPHSLYTPLGLAQRRLGETGLAKQSLLEAVRARDSDIAAWNELGLIAMQDRKWEEARGYFERALHAQGNYPPALYNLGLVYRALGMRPEAVRSFRNYLQADPSASDAETVRGWVSSLAQN